MAEPVTLDELKAHLRVGDDDDSDALLQAYLTAGREWVENYTGLVLVPRKVSQSFDRFSCLRDLNAWPVAADATFTLTYADTSGADMTVTNARLDVSRRPARLYPAFGATWPVAYNGSIVVTLTAGYATPEAVPASLKAAILLVAAGLYNNREDGVVGATYVSTGTVEALCAPYRFVGLG